ncbi:MAG: M12 family metallo-peptidase [Rhizobiaceae bacterium]|jgi:hypothetical protein|nr:M12 family metallo-peptidase [Rhizobiaceae bacterium]
MWRPFFGKWFRALGTLGAALIVGLAPVAGAGAADLFGPFVSQDAVGARAAPDRIGLVAQRFTRLNAREVARSLLPQVSGSEGARTRAALKLNPTLSIPLAPDLRVTFQRSFVEARAEGGVEWTGDMLRGQGEAVIIAGPDGLLGHVSVGSRVFRIQPVANGLHRISEHAPEALPLDKVVPAPTRRSGGMTPEIGNPLATVPPVTITVLPVFTKRARDGAVADGTTIQREINLAFALANTGLRNSGVNARFVASTPVAAPASYNEFARGQDALLDDITSGPMFANVRAIRDRRRVDLVALIPELDPDGGFCGVAWLVENPSRSTARLGFSWTARECFSNLTFHHEIGHNIGLQHDRYVVTNPVAGSFNYGFVNVAARVRTIMAYRDRCEDQGVTCNRVNMFSTPLRRFGGKVVGNTGNDASRMLRRNMRAVAAYR